MDIYIKPEKKFKAIDKNKIYIKDIAEVFAPSEILKKVENIKILEIKESKNKSYLISIIDVIKSINMALPGHTVNNVGEIDTVVEYSMKEKDANKALLYLKIAFVSLVLWAGSATAIMSFHSDAQMATVFENYYYIFFNEKIENPLIIDLPYSIGLAVGIVVFFNHLSGKKLTSDPTPIEVEMTLYEDEITDNVIDTLNNERNKNGNS